MRTVAIGEQQGQPDGRETPMSAPSSMGRATTAPPGDVATGRPARETHDWERLAGTPEFQRLHQSRRRFTLTGMAIQTGALILVMGLYGWAPEAMGEPAIGSITWALLSGAALILLTFVLAWAYSRKARQWEAMAAAALEHAGERSVEPTGRFSR
jgi:uncharacterized membrane protein (DUF485 family)